MCPYSFDLNKLNNEFETQSPQDILAWSWEIFQPKVAVSSSLQTQSVPLLHMLAQVCPDITMIFLDTGYHFPETLAFRDELERELGLNIQTIYPDPQANQHLENPAEPLYRRDPDLCCRINKVEPMTRALSGLEAWVTGIRREQTKHRKNIQIVERRHDGLIKVNPLANWTKRDLWAYINRHGLPLHPLFHKGYRSIGCAPCTRPVSEGENDRAGRWDGTAKTECGLHTMVIPLQVAISSPDSK